MKPLALVTLCLLTACQRAAPSDCRPLQIEHMYKAPELTEYERDMLIAGDQKAAFASGWACGFRDGVNSRKLVIDLP